MDFKKNNCKLMHTIHIILFMLYWSLNLKNKTKPTGKYEQKPQTLKSNAYEHKIANKTEYVSSV